MSPTSGSFLSFQQFGDLLDQPRLLHQKGNLGDDDHPGAARALFLLPFGAGAERAAAGHIGLGDGLLGIDDDAAGREIRPLDVFQQRLRLRLGLLDQVQRGVAEFGGVVRRDRGRHADRDALRAVGEQVRKAAGQHDRLFRLAVVIGAEFDAVLVDAVEQKLRDLGHARFGVAVGGGVIAVDVAEIALAVDQRVARGEILRQAHHGVVDRLVAMRMERTHHVADDFCRFLERRAGVEPQQAHAVEDAAMHRLQPVAGVRQGAMHDGGEGISEIALLERIAQHDLVNFGRFFRRQLSFSHGEALNPDGESGKSANQRQFRAFSREVGTGSREENASQQDFGASVLIQSESKSGSAAKLRNRRFRPIFGHRVDKPVAGVGMALPARFQHMAQQE